MRVDPQMKMQTHKYASYALKEWHQIAFHLEMLV